MQLAGFLHPSFCSQLEVLGFIPLSDRLARPQAARGLSGFLPEAMGFLRIQ
jgi:hypothetical protein